MKARSSLVLVALAGASLAALPAAAQSTKEKLEALDTRIGALEKGIAERMATLDQRLAALAEVEKRLANIEAQLQRTQAQGGAAGGAAQPVSPADDQKARALLDEINQLVAKGDVPAAQAKMSTLMMQYGATTTARSAQRLQGELAVYGKSAPDDYGIEKWLQGEKEIDLKSGKPTLIVFWELWCPHCRREVPRIQELFAQYQPKGLQVLGMTKLSRSSTEESLQSFAAENGLKYPMAKENGLASAYFGVQGVPAAAVLKDGRVIWRGHPARITNELIASWL